MSENETNRPAVEDDGRVKPRKAFYMVLPVINSDDTVNPFEAVSHCCDTLAAAVECSKEDIDGGEDEVHFIYECRPVRRVARGWCRVQPLMKPAK